MAQGDIELARQKLPLKSLMEQYGDAPLDGKWGSMVCPACKEKGASVRDAGGRQWFKCFKASCPSGTAAAKSAWDEVAYLGFKHALTRKNAYIEYLKVAGVWRERERLAPSLRKTPRRRPLPDEGADNQGPAVSADGACEPPGAVQSTPPAADGPGDPVAPPPPSAAPPAPPPPAPPAKEGEEIDDEDQPGRALERFYSQIKLEPDDVEKLWRKRGLTPDTCARAGFRSARRANAQILESLRAEFPPQVLLDAGLFVTCTGGVKPAPQLTGWGIVGKREDGEMEWGQTEPVLIPYAAGPRAHPGNLQQIRPHKGFAKGHTPRLYVAHHERDAKFTSVVVTEGEFKAWALKQVFGAKLGVAALPGITMSKSATLPVFDELVCWLDSVEAERVTVAFDSEEKGDPKLPGYKEERWKRHETEVWARYLAQQLFKKGFDARVCHLPTEWRNAAGKADWDGALAMMTQSESQPHTVWPAAADGIKSAFHRALTSAVRVQEFEQGGLDEDERIIFQRLAWISYEPTCPEGGEMEERIARRLFGLARAFRKYPARIAQSSSESIKGVVGHIRAVASAYMTLKGGYYILKNKPQKDQWAEWLRRRQAASDHGDSEVVWLCNRMMLGVPERFTDFVLEPHHVLLKEDGTRARVVTVRYMHGRPSEPILLDHVSLSAPTRFREWLNKSATGAWRAGERELQALQTDLNFLMSRREVHQVASFGTHASGLWFFGDCAYGPNGRIQRSRDGLYWYDGQGYQVFESDIEGQEFCQSAPLLRPDKPTHEVLGAPPGDERMAVLEFLMDTCLRLNQTLGDFHGYMVMGALLAYGASPEIYRHWTCFPGLWLHGESRQGKSSVARWLMRMWGFGSLDTGRPMKNCTKVGLSITLNQYSNLPVWWEEFQTDAQPFVVELIKNIYNREAGMKWLAEGQVARRIRTSVVITGEATSSDSATRSRYVHAQVSGSKRVADHYRWFEDNHHKFYLFGRFIMEHRAAYAAALLKHHDAWMADPQVALLDRRSAVVYGVAYAGLNALAELLPKAPWSMDRFLDTTRRACRAAIQEVNEQVKVDQLWEDLMAAFKNDEFGHGPTEVGRFFKAVKQNVMFAPGTSTQDQSGVIREGEQSAEWVSWRLYLTPQGVFNTVAAYLRRQNRPMPLSIQDIHAQMAQRPYFVPGQHRQRFGTGGGVTACWCISLDDFPQRGYTPMSDEELAASQAGVARHDWADPRRGPLYDIVAALQRREDPE